MNKTIFKKKHKDNLLKFVLGVMLVFTFMQVNAGRVYAEMYSSDYVGYNEGWHYYRSDEYNKDPEGDLSEGNTLISGMQRKSQYEACTVFLDGNMMKFGYELESNAKISKIDGSTMYLCTSHGEATIGSLCDNCKIKYSGSDAGINWSYDSTKNTLSISANSLAENHGTMSDWSYNAQGYYGNRPWAPWIAVIKNIEINSGVTTIGDWAFFECTNLKSIRISEGVKTIGNFAFSRCTGLVNVELPDGLEKIGESAFNECGKITEITLPASVTLIGASSFQYCEELESINIPSGISTISNKIFYNCKALKEVNIPAGVTSIGNDAFHNCIALETVNIPAGVTSIGEDAFYNCIALETVNIPAGVTSIGNNAFNSCKLLESVELPSSVTTIGQHAFNGCSSLKSVNIPSGVTSIEQQLFDGCKALKSIVIPSSVTTIESYAFDGCKALKSITFEGNPSTIDETAFAIGENDSNKCKPIILKFGKNVTKDTVVKVLNITDKSKLKRVIVNDELVDSLKNEESLTGVKDKIIASSKAITEIIISSVPTKYIEENGKAFLVNNDGTLATNENIVIPSTKYNAVDIETLKYETVDMDMPFLLGLALLHPDEGCEFISVDSDYKQDSEYKIEIPGVPYSVYDGAIYVEQSNVDIYNETYGENIAKLGDTAVMWIIEKTYRVTLDANGHGDATYALADNTVISKPADPVVDGYTFAGWYQEAACKNAWDFDSDVVSENTTLYAKWVLSEYSITYTLDGGKNDSSNPSVYTIETETITLKDATKDGYKFLGWYASDEAREPVTKIDKGTTGNITLIARWENNTASTPTPTPYPDFKPNDPESNNGWGDIDEEDKTVIDPSLVTDETISITGIKDAAYTGSAITFDIRVYKGTNLLKEGSDYTVKYVNNKNAWEAVGDADDTADNQPTVILTGKGSYKDALEGYSRENADKLKFKIKKYNLENSAALVSNMSAVFKNSKPQKAYKPLPGVMLDGKKLKNGTDYKITYLAADGLTAVDQYTEAGTYKIKIEGQNNYTGSLSSTYYLVDTKNTDSVLMSSATIQGIKNSVAYTGNAISLDDVKDSNRFKVTAKINNKATELELGRDYEVTALNNVSAGTASLIFKAIDGNENKLVGEKTVSFKITGTALSKTSIVLKDKAGNVSTAFTYTGSQIKPTVVVTTKGGNSETLKDGTDYTVEYQKNINVGTATVLIKGMGKYTGTVKKAYKIKAVDFAKAAKVDEVTGKSDLVATVDSEAIVKNEKTKKYEPKVKVLYKGRLLAEDKDYTLSYKNNKKPGTAQVIIKGKGNFAKTKKLTFTIE